MNKNVTWDVTTDSHVPGGVTRRIGERHILARTASADDTCQYTPLDFQIPGHALRSNTDRAS